VAAVLGPLVQLGGCRRQADIRDEPDGSLTVGPKLDAGELVVVDSGLESDAYPACADRPTGECVGSNDFPCAFEGWVAGTAQDCQKATGCNTNGWLEVKMGADGCVVEIGMEKPNDEMIACLVAEFGFFRCPCGEVEASHLFGYGNTGTCPGPTG
jgi:hypothetical protein